MGDNVGKYRPHESPANGHIEDGAGDAGGTLQCSSGKINAVSFSAVQPRRLKLLKVTSNAFLTEELALGDLGPTGMVQAFKTASTLISVRQAVPLVVDPGL